MNKYSFRYLNMNTYTNDMMADDIAKFRAGKHILSGFENLDDITSLYPGFYVLGAISSLGKTTFMHQMCDQMAAAGHHVLFFSLEQSALELASKSLSRIMAQKDASNALSSLEIRVSDNDSKVSDAIAEYSTYSGNVTVVECTFQISIADIEDTVRDYITKTGIRPIVIVDYLQVICPPENSHLNAKDLVDTNVRRLKILQSTNKLVLIAISSLNRQNYLSPVDYESFKESGGIEYTADVVWGLQLQVLSKDFFVKESKIDEKRKLVKEEKAANPRKIELVCLKNRFGVSSYSRKFDYYPKFDLFIPEPAECPQSPF